MKAPLDKLTKSDAARSQSRTRPESTMEALEDRLDAEDAAAALAELDRGEDKAIPGKKAKKDRRRRKEK